MAKRRGIDTQRALKRLVKHLNKVQKHLDRADLLLDGITHDIHEIEGENELSATSRAGPAGRVAAREAASLQMKARRDGSSSVRIDGGGPFRLTRTLTAILRILVTGGDDDRKTPAGWKTKEEIARLLEKRLGRNFHPHAVANLIHRLRGALEHNGLSRDLLRTDRKRGARLVVRREAIIDVTEAASS
ncbi:MAG: hypothetical protein O7A63_07385 [Acidobacteria bacterium]|nr:hypothetical protein [Acidobacteriota bacterium]